DFPDLPHDANQLNVGDTDMYYSSYPTSHYQQLLFSETGFTGPSNQTLQSAHQYFQAVSGNSFYFTGQVQDWVTADNNAAYYGGNDSDDNDKAVPELVKEAVTKAVSGMSDTELESYDIEDPFDIDGDGNYDEADGIIDHVMLFHSSIGEEAGGGVLGEDAIWSHRFYVDSNTNGYVIPGRALKIFGYTVQPIDAAAGVCTHEFGHDLGLPDEYDTTNSGDGSPVGSWSLMSGGSWTGSIAGAQPSGFSPYAKSFLQQKYKGKWVNEQHISLADLTSSGTAVQLNHAVNTDAVNQLSIALPAEAVAFKAPLTGQYQYYSGQGNMINNAMSFDVTLPLDTPLALSFQAHWDIEDDY
ncbi:immune inhibitor A, partial [Shewanella sp. SR41-2]|nr:immune inhibitor A [Shewanella sp. SR41-2]